MTTVFFELKLHTPDVFSTVGGGWIMVKSITRDEEGNILLTPHCAGVKEIEWQFDQMQKDIEKMRKIARKKFAEFKNMPLKPPIP